LDGWIGFLAQRGSVELRNILLGPAPPEQGQAVFRVGEGVTVPRVLRQEKPSYTPQAMKARIEGTVLVECVIEPDGSVSKAVLVRSLDDQFGLDDEALRAARLWPVHTSDATWSTGGRGCGDRDGFHAEIKARRP